MRLRLRPGEGSCKDHFPELAPGFGPDWVDPSDRLLPVVVCAALLGCAGSQPVSSPGGTTHEDLVELYGEFVEFRVPEIEGGVPDYTPAAMRRKEGGLARLQSELARMDTAGWSISEKVDYRVVEAEMRAMEFDHRVLRPWSRDPAFYVVVNFQFGPKMYGASGLPSLPLDADEVEPLRERFQAIADILAQARSNLTEPAADLAMIGVRTKDREAGLLEDYLEALPEHHPDLVDDGERALAAILDFRDWLEAEQSGWTAPSGIGTENYTWFMQNVMLLPYSWEALVTITERDLDRALALMALEEHRNRGSQAMAVMSAAEFRTARREAQQALYDFLHHEEVMTVPDFIEPPAAPPSSVESNEGDTGEPQQQLDYFGNVNRRDPLPLMPHDYMGHGPDAARRRRDDRPIRGANRLFFIDGQRQDGYSTWVEQLVMHLGILDDRPRARELSHNLLALRAVRAMADLKMHSNEMTVAEAFQYNIDNTPKGWLPEDSPTMWHDLELYLRQPGYGVGYLIGVAQMEQLLAERATQLGDAFVLRDFMDEFLEGGLIPISLIRWEMTSADAAPAMVREGGPDAHAGDVSP